MIWLFPAKFSPGKSRSVQRKLMEGYYRLIPQVAVRRAALVLTVSQAAKNDIVQQLQLAPDRIVVTHEATSPIFRQVKNAPQIENIRRKFDLKSAFILGIGSADPRKNIRMLVEAYALLPAPLRETYKLAIVLTHSLLESDLTTQIAQLRVKEGVQFLRQVKNEDLPLLFNAASLFVFPSLYEGFGLPLLEAMACGTPVVAADNSSIPEIVGDAAALVEARNPKAIADTMMTVLTDESLYAALKRKGLERAASFSWETCARETLTSYRRALRALEGERRLANAHSF